MNNIQTITLYDFINTIFTKEPSMPCSYKIDSDVLYNKDPILHRQKMLPILMNILLLGAKKLFGENIKPTNITEEQFNILQKYFKSIGFSIRYNHTFHNDIPIKINLWFDRYNIIQNCNGTIIY